MDKSAMQGEDWMEAPDEGEGEPEPIFGRKYMILTAYGQKKEKILVFYRQYRDFVGHYANFGEIQAENRGNPMVPAKYVLKVPSYLFLLKHQPTCNPLSVDTMSYHLYLWYPANNQVSNLLLFS